VAYLYARSTAEDDTLRVWQSFFSWTGFKYSFGDLEGDVGMGGSKVKSIVGSNPLALGKVETFGRFQVPSFVLSLTSAAVLGWGIGSDDRDLVYVGLGGMLVGLIVDQIGYRYLKSGVRVYNKGLE
jgi:hypothetical protein